MGVAAVLTVPYFAKDAASAMEGLKELCRLPVALVVVVYDRKSAEGKRVSRKARKAVSARLRAQGKKVVLLEVDEFDTTLRWRRGILKAFEDDDVRAVMLCPGDMDPHTPEAQREDLRRGLEQMLAGAGPDVLWLGDYASADHFKTCFDDLIGRRIVEILFPELTPQLEEIGISKLRTEFMLIGRGVFEHSEAELRFVWGTDPTPQVALSTASNEALKVQEPVWLGEFSDDPNQRRPLGQMHQIVRYMAQFVNSRLVGDRPSAKTDEAQLERYLELLPVLDETFSAAAKALRDNLVPADNLTLLVRADQMPELQHVVASVQEDLEEVRAACGLPGDAFELKRRPSRHATVLGLEVIRLGDSLYNANFALKNGQLRMVEPRRLLNILERFGSSGDPLLTVRFGGFRKAYCMCHGDQQLHGWECNTSSAEFHRFGRSAYEGSFYGYPEGAMMLTGWPVEGSGNLHDFPRTLYGLRHAAEDAGYLDKYHSANRTWALDDDFYLRLGSFRNCRKGPVEHFVEEVRERLSAREPMTVDVKLEDLWIVYYRTPSLSDEAVGQIRAQDAIDHPERLEELYQRWLREH